jgi:tight adherence protein B
MGRMTAYVLVGLPFFIGGVLTVIDGNFMAPLWHQHSGHILLLVGMTMMAIGSVILKKIVSFRG